ncbi:MAG: glycoside hydrolase family 43 protein [Eubacterium sp.]
MRNNEINIRDPFVLEEDGIFYLYGTRAENFGVQTGGFDVYTSRDLEEWSQPTQCFNSKKCRLNHGVNWAPEVHKYKGKYYMFATFTTIDQLRGTYAFVSDSPMGPFEPHSHGALTPENWSSLDGSLYVDKNGVPYLYFCHEHTQIVNGTICVVELSEDLTEPKGEVTTLFHGSEPYYVTRKRLFQYFVTDGPFMYENKNGELMMLWSTSIDSQYCQCCAKNCDGNVFGPFEHLKPLITDDGGHGMIFKNGDKLMLAYHTPNKSGLERPVFREIEDTGIVLELK